MKKVVVITNNNEYGMLDFDLLRAEGVAVIPLVDKSNQQSYPNEIVLNDFSFMEVSSVISKIRPDYICCFYDRYMLDIARIREDLAIPGLRTDELNLIINKRHACERISRYLRTPKTLSLENEASYHFLKRYLGQGDIFIKPHSLSGSESTAHIKSELDYENFKKTMRFPCCSYIAQEYISGELYHVDCFVKDHMVIFSSARRYSAPNHEMLQKDIPLFSLEIEDELLNGRLISSAQLVAQKLRIKNGVMHVEFFVTSFGEIVFIETNLRYPGIGINLLYKEKLGFSFETAHVLLESDAFTLEIRPNEKYYFCGYYPVPKKPVINIKKPSLSIDFNFTDYLKEFPYQGKPRTLSKSASIVAWSDSLDELSLAYQSLLHQEVVCT